MVRLMVSTTLVTVTQLSKLVFDQKKGLKRTHRLQGTENDVMSTIAEEASDEDGVIDNIQVGEPVSRGLFSSKQRHAQPVLGGMASQIACTHWISVCVQDAVDILNNDVGRIAGELDDDDAVMAPGSPAATPAGVVSGVPLLI